MISHPFHGHPSALSVCLALLDLLSSAMGTSFCGADRMSSVACPSPFHMLCPASDEPFDARRVSMLSNRDKASNSETNATQLVLPGQCLIEQTFDLAQDLAALRELYPSFPPLPAREFSPSRDVNVNDDDQKSASSSRLLVQQFNMLADGLSSAYRATANAKTFVGVDLACLQWTYRGLRLVEEMTRLDADVLALEECDQMRFVRRYLARRGYDGLFQEKTASPISHVRRAMAAERGVAEHELAMPKDGVALFFKRDALQVADEAAVQRIDMQHNDEQVTALAVPLRRVDAEAAEALFVVTHLKSTKSAKGEQHRKRQIDLLLRQLVANPRRLPLVLCCDLNANPVQNKNGYEPLCYEHITSTLGFESAYKLRMGAEPEYTTYKLREHGEDKHCIDYIFLRPSERGRFAVQRVLQIPDIEQGRIPSWSYPSDHFSIAAELSWQGASDDK